MMTSDNWLFILWSQVTRYWCAGDHPCSLLRQGMHRHAVSNRGLDHYPNRTRQKHWFVALTPAPTAVQDSSYTSQWGVGDTPIYFLYRDVPTVRVSFSESSVLNSWSSLEQRKKLQHFLLDRVAKFTSLCLEQGQGFVESVEPPYPNSCWFGLYLMVRLRWIRLIQD